MNGDSRSSAGVDSALKLLDPMWKVQQLADPIHLGQSQFRKCYKANFSPDMFTGSTREQKREAQKVFSQDMKARCSLIIKELMKLHTGNIGVLKRNLPKVMQSTLSCYSGDCSKCSRYSVVCSGGITNNWWHRSMFLGTHRITKNVNYSRTMTGRAASTIHRLNNAPGTSMIEKCKYCGIELSARVRRSLRQMDKESDYQKRYQNNPQVVKRHSQRADNSCDHSYSK
ncbi:uncharacterized protein LOC121386780 [Gigantopelta aegis]|uniref:uncharacterized protein LOC121386780 n=1 Tax=Gigantopelta aegis TaxID=1735272 RepID=UPI001B88CC87|nr:uncharacterized protein LOC121386780 [Gigantopelta aegis]